MSELPSDADFYRVIFPEDDKEGAKPRSLGVIHYKKEYNPEPEATNPVLFALKRLKDRIEATGDASPQTVQNLSAQRNDPKEHVREKAAAELAQIEAFSAGSVPELTRWLPFFLLNADARGDKAILKLFHDAFEKALTVESDLQRKRDEACRAADAIKSNVEPDGPVEPDGYRDNGTLVEKLPPRIYNCLKHLSQGGAADFESVAEATETEESGLQTLCRDANRVLAKAGVTLRLQNKSARIKMIHVKQ